MPKGEPHMTTPNTPRIEQLCPNCGANLDKLSSTSRFCYKCGAQLPENTPLAPPPPSVQPPDESVTPPPPPSAQPRRALADESVTPNPATRPKPENRPPRKGFKLVDHNVLFGLFGLIDLAISVVVALVWVGIPLLDAQATACQQINPKEFVPFTHEALEGALEKDTQLEGNTDYIVRGNFVVPQGRQLFIPPGVTLLFAEDASMEIQGDIYACGSTRKPVSFTSEKTVAGSWGRIFFNAAGEHSVLNHVLIQFASDRALYMQQSAPMLDDVKIGNSAAFALSTDGNLWPKTVWKDVNLDDNPFSGVEIRGGTLNEKMTRWANIGLVYIVSDNVIVGPETTLVIDPGVTVKFWKAQDRSHPAIGVHGLLKAEQVRFVSVYDDRTESGGATYLDARDAKPGDWFGIAFYQDSSQTSTLRGSLIQYAGSGQHGAIWLEGSSPDLREVHIADTQWYPVSTDADSFPNVGNSKLTNNDPANALEIRGGSIVTKQQGQAVWDVLGDAQNQLVRVVQGAVTIENEATLTIKPGVVVKFGNDGLLTVKGTLQAAGGPDAPQQIVFTSLFDADYGGDATKAGPQTERTWQGIRFVKADRSSTLSNALVRYASISFDAATPQLNNVTVADVQAAALWASPDAQPELHNMHLERNAINGVGVWGADITTDQIWHRWGEDQPLVRVLVGAVKVTSLAALTIEPGVIIKANDKGRLIVDGTLRLLGEEQQPVTITSLHDDIGGDTNQKLQEPAANDWRGIDMNASAKLFVAYTQLRYSQYGLIWNSLPTALTISGWLQVTDGGQPIWCTDTTAAMPANLVANNNHNNNTTQCPNF